MISQSTHYIGRFAPSPSGPLHFGSLVCALASYLDAKQHSGKWLVRMEDIDPPREQLGAKSLILNTLKQHGLHWDGTILYQSQRHQAYREALKTLEAAKLSYKCSCTRKQLSARISPPKLSYDSYCLKHPPNAGTPAAIRINLNRISQFIENKNNTNTFEFIDGIQGKQSQSSEEIGDFIIHRKDGLFAYNLAVVVDDLFQGVTNVVRGNDLLNTTLQQKQLMIALCQCQQRTAPSICHKHIPVAVDSEGHKLSKQNHSPPIDNTSPIKNLRSAFIFLEIPPPPADLSLHDILSWGVAHWNPKNIKNRQSAPAPLL